MMPNISLDRTGDAGRIWLDCCMLRVVRGQAHGWPRPISSRALSFARRLHLSFSMLCPPPDGAGACEIFHRWAEKQASQEQEAGEGVRLIAGQAPRSQVVCAFQAAL